MKISIPTALCLGHGEYGDDVRRRSGAKIGYIEVHDPDQPQGVTVRLTLGEDVDPSTLPAYGEPCSIEGVGTIRDGKTKLRCDSVGKAAAVKTTPGDLKAA